MVQKVYLAPPTGDCVHGVWQVVLNLVDDAMYIRCLRQYFVQPFLQRDILFCIVITRWHLAHTHTHNSNTCTAWQTLCPDLFVECAEDVSVGGMHILQTIMKRKNNFLRPVSLTILAAMTDIL